MPRYFLALRSEAERPVVSARLNRLRGIHGGEFQTESAARRALDRLATLSLIHGGEEGAFRAYRAEVQAEQEASDGWSQGEMRVDAWRDLAVERPGRMKPLAAKILYPDPESTRPDPVPGVKTAGGAAGLLAAPLLPGWEQVERTAAEEAGHATVLLALGGQVTRVSAPGRFCYGTPPTDPQERAAVALAGYLAVDREGAWKAVQEGWGALSLRLSAGDARELRAAMAPGDPDYGGYALTLIRPAAALAAGTLAVHRPAYQRIREGLLRHTGLSGEECQVLFDAQGAGNPYYR